jgi:hypothetical protein
MSAFELLTFIFHQSGVKTFDEAPSGEALTKLDVKAAGLVQKKTLSRQLTMPGGHNHPA